jgi:2-amino-4-hydroxy-6-hydroxymethyldihydropteridine diphosphokinase
VFLGLGANLGDRARNLETAVRGIRRIPGIVVEATAKPLETAPVGGPPGQGKYLNSACALSADVEPLHLLRALQAVERGLGRERTAATPRWGPRPIDIDVLLWGERIVALPELTVPHPRLAERHFALAPLAELDPDARHPVLGLTIGELLARLRR